MNYIKSHRFTDVKLNSCFVQYIKFNYYGDPYANSDMEYPTFGWGSSSEQYKNSISKFMLSDRDYQDEDDLHGGNPTKSKQVNVLIKAIKKSKVQESGTPSNLKPDLLSPMLNTVTSCIYIIKGIGNVDKHLFCSVVL